MKKLTIAMMTAAGLMVSASALARVDVGVNIGVPGVIYGPPPVVYAPPPPVYYAPAPVVVAPPVVAGGGYYWSHGRRYYRGPYRGHGGLYYHGRPYYRR